MKTNKIITILLFFFLCGSARAYVLPAPTILDLLIKSFGKEHSLKVSQRLIYFKNNEKAWEEDGTSYFLFPDHFRSESKKDDNLKIHLFSTDQSITVVDEKISSVTETRPDHYKDILLFRNRTILEKKLALLGVDLLVSSLGRFNDKIVYIVGAQYPDESPSQVWLDQKTFRPVRLILRPLKAGEEPIDIRYEKWSKFSHAWYPLEIEIYRNGDISRKIQAEDLVSNPSFPEKFFDPDQFKSIYPSVLTDKISNDKKDDLSDVQKSIDNFKMIFQ